MPQEAAGRHGQHRLCLIVAFSHAARRGVTNLIGFVRVLCRVGLRVKHAG